jgi:hypothetical protein
MNIEERITKKTNLPNDDSLSSFDGHSAQQNHGVYEVFYDFLNKIKPSRVLEIGTSLGGFTTFLKITCNELELNTNIRSYDINQHPWYDSIRERGVDLRVENIFTENFVDIDDEVKEYIKQEGITVVLCDGGWKIGEFNVLSKYIKSGDYIMAHDYAENKEVFEERIKDKIWNWHEISDSDVSQATIENNLEIYDKDTFENVVWTCRRKI